jgi:hypothetical protein
MTPLIIVCSIIISMLLGALFYIVKQPLNSRKIFQRSIYSGAAFTAALRLIATTNKTNSSTIALIGGAIGIIICFYLGWSLIGMRKEKKESA